MSDEAIQVPAGLTTDGLLGRRYMARFIDSLFIGLLIGVLVGLEGTFRPRIAGSPAGFLLILLNLALFLIVWIGYGAAFESSPWQATLGKRFTGLRVYNSTGGRLTPLQAVSRNLVKDGPFVLFGFIPSLGFLALIWLGAHLVVLYRSPVYQAIHDRIAQTWVAAPEATIQLHLT